MKKPRANDIIGRIPDGEFLFSEFYDSLEDFDVEKTRVRAVLERMVTEGRMEKYKKDGHKFLFYKKKP